MLRRCLSVISSGRNEVSGVAGARGGDRGIVGMREGVTESDARRGGLHGVRSGRTIEHVAIGWPR